MKNHIAFKFIAILLCACCLLCTVASAAAIITLTATGLYESTPEELFQNSKTNAYENLAYRVACRYAAANLGNCPDHLIHHVYSFPSPDSNLLGYSIADESGTILYSDLSEATNITVYTTIVSPSYPKVLSYAEYYQGQLIDPTIPTTEPTQEPDTPSADGEISPEPTEEYHYKETYGYYIGDTQYVYQLGFLHAPIYTVTLHILPEADNMSGAEQLVTQVWEHRDMLPVVLGVSLLLAAVFFVYLCCAAAKAPGRDSLQPGGLNLLSLDLYAGLVCAAGFLGIYGMAVLIDNFFNSMPFSTLALLVVADGFFLCLLVVGFLFACAAQFKMGGFYWWKHSLTGMAICLAWRIFLWCFQLLRRCLSWLPGFVKKIFSWGVTLCRKLWQIAASILSFFWDILTGCFRWVGNQISQFYQLLPLTWQWLLTACGMGLVLLLGFASREVTGLLLALGVCVAIILYGTNAFGKLMEAARRMSQGDLTTKVDDSLMVGCFKDFSTHLNDLAGVATVAAQKQMRSERMKAELVTNVSHDIKTPLTSIINYVDLLQKAKSQEEAEEYLEVLSRQSQRMKKLIDDLMEMSKASTGNLNVEITQVNATEAINQALGEFADKLAAASLTPVFHAPEKPVLMQADGRLAWRVLSNLLGNAVKYALPNTRLYIDLVRLENQVLISLKNISREPLNVSSEELMERFVRGDASRNTEGSGLGLNIAKSLMEVQGGQLQLLIDGDLFKATLLFPAL